MTLGQIGLAAIGLLTAFFLGSKVPHDWKLHNIPAGFLFGLIIFCVSLVLGRMTELKPIVWWRNNFLYGLRMMPTLYLPKPEELTHIYPDPTIEERGHIEEYYVEQ
jgi:hypothetical protein